MDHSGEQPQAEALPEEQAGTEEEQAAAAAVQAAPVDLQQLAALEIPQLVDYSGLSQGQPNLMPAITTLIMHITQHLSNPNGNPQLALTFQPLVNMALNMQLSTSVPDMSAMYNVPSALMAAAAANAGQVQFDPQVLMAGATAAAAAAAGGTPAADSAATADGQPATQQQQQKRKGGGRRKVVAAAQLEEEEEEEEEEAVDDDDEDWSWKNTKSSRGNSSSRPQRQRKKSRLLQEYLTDDEEALGEPTRGRRAFEY